MDLQPEPKKATLGPSTRTQEGNPWTFNQNPRRQPLDLQREAKKVNPWTFNQNPRRQPLDLQREAKVNPWTSREKQRRSILGLPHLAHGGAPTQLPIVTHSPVPCNVTTNYWMLSCFLSKSPKKGVIGLRDSLEEGTPWTFKREQEKATLGLPERTEEGTPWTSRENRRRQSLDFQREQKKATKDTLSSRTCTLPPCAGPSVSDSLHRLAT